MPGAQCILHLWESMSMLLVPGVPVPSPGQAERVNGVKDGCGLRAWWAHLVIYGLQDTPHMVLRHSQAQLLPGLPQGRVHHILVSRVTLATWETEQAQEPGSWTAGAMASSGGQCGRGPVTPKLLPRVYSEASRPSWALYLLEQWR